jgi:hypothetical protein
MFYGGKEEQDKAIMNEVEIRRRAAAVFPHLRNVLESFDGKVFNCRLQNKLREDGNYWIVELKRNERYGDYLNITFSPKNFSGRTTWFSVLGVNMKDCEGWDGKRIPAAALIQNARENREKLLKEAAAIESMIERAPELEKQIKYFKKQIEALVDSIPYTAQLIYNLGYRVRS